VHDRNAQTVAIAQGCAELVKSTYCRLSRVAQNLKNVPRLSG